MILLSIFKMVFGIIKANYFREPLKSILKTILFNTEHNTKMEKKRVGSKHFLRMEKLPKKDFIIKVRRTVYTQAGGPTATNDSNIILPTVFTMAIIKNGTKQVKC